MILIGITGTNGAGKGAIVDFLVKQKGFIHLSVRQYLSNVLIEQKKIINRDTLFNLANSLRNKYGNDYIIRKLYEKACAENRNAVIESIRNPGEISFLKSKGNFFLIAVDADINIRYQRIVLRASETDNISFEDFVKTEQREMNQTDSDKQNILKCIEIADVKIINNGSLNELHNKIEDFLNSITNKSYKRPSWDEYFLEVLNAVSKRATCDRGRSGCVIAKNNQILVTGYVGSPIGFEHCDDVGHLMKKVIHEDGSITNHCMRTVHAEQNAICQAAKLGISIDGATLYCRMTPCRTCAMLIVNCGIKRVVCQKKYHAGKESEDIFRKANIQLDYIDDEIQQYDNQ